LVEGNGEIRSQIIRCQLIRFDNFIFDIKEKGRELTISMTPVKGTSLSEYFRNINMIMDKSDFTVSMLTMVEITGDSTELLFIDKKLNGKIDESEFSVK